MSIRSHLITAVALAATIAFVTHAHAHDKPVTPPPPPAPPQQFYPGNFSKCIHAPDNSGGQDAHIGFSAAFGIASAGVFRSRTWYEQIGIAMIPGVLKEIRDCNTSGLFSRRDLVNDLIGASIGVAAGNGALYLERKRQQDGTTKTAVTYVTSF